MHTNTQLPKKHFYLMITFCAILIMCESLQVLVSVKNPKYFTFWAEMLQNSAEATFAVYLNVQLMTFFMNVITPMMLGLHSYVAFVKIRIGKLFVFIWTVLLLGGLAYTVMEWNVYSGFYYVKILSYVLIILTVLSLNAVINEHKVI